MWGCSSGVALLVYRYRGLGRGGVYFVEYYSCLGEEQPQKKKNAVPLYPYHCMHLTPATAFYGYVGRFLIDGWVFHACLFPCSETPPPPSRQRCLPGQRKPDVLRPGIVGV